MVDRDDREQLEERGISEEELERQLRMFAEPPRPIHLDRPCTVGDGIVVLDAAERAAALAAAARALASDRVMKFVPASGAATRMFHDLMAVRGQGVRTRSGLKRRADSEPAARETLKFFDNLERFAFHDALAAAVRRRGGDLMELRRSGDVAGVLGALLDAGGMHYGAAPKGLILFHRYSDENRTAFEEHLVEGAVLARHGHHPARLHCTVSPEHEPQFGAVAERSAARVTSRHGVRCAVTFSHQAPSTDTIAVDSDNRPFRTAGGRLLFRPGGHGSLIGNLDALCGDVIFIKNIDNIPQNHLRDPVVEWTEVLIGHLVRVQDALFAHRAALEPAEAGPAEVAAARDFVMQTLHEAVPDGGDARAALRAILDRPLRVCGMVPNTGEPGGGPFWVREASGARTLQIVESAQVDRTADEQRAIFAAATHFNPVVMACGVRNWRDEPFNLHEFVDQDAVFIAEKSKEGRPLKALERPGLWNGAMARWHTIFVEVSDVTFTPVKTVNDLLRSAHQPPADGAPGPR